MPRSPDPNHSHPHCTLDRQQACQKVSTYLATLTIYNLNVFFGEEILTQFRITYYRDNTCGVEGGTTSASFRNINTKTPIAVAQEAQQFPHISTHVMVAK
jgi:hypothetical protein